MKKRDKARNKRGLTEREGGEASRRRDKRRLQSWDVSLFFFIYRAIFWTLVIVLRVLSSFIFRFLSLVFLFPVACWFILSFLVLLDFF
jgi:hypothetical protein